MTEANTLGRPTAAFVGASWLALAIGFTLYCVGLWNANMELVEKGYYLAVFLFGLFAAVALQKAVRDRDEGIPVTALFLGVSWAGLLISIALLSIGLFNAQDLLRSEKGFYGATYVLAIFAVVVVQKNVRDLAAYNKLHPDTEPVLEPKRPEKGAPPLP